MNSNFLNKFCWNQQCWPTVAGCLHCCALCWARSKHCHSLMLLDLPNYCACNRQIWTTTIKCHRLSHIAPPMHGLFSSAWNKCHLLMNCAGVDLAFCAQVAFTAFSDVGPIVAASIALHNIPEVSASSFLGCALSVYASTVSGDQQK